MITVSSATMQWLLWRLAVLPLVLIVSNRSSTYSYSYSYNYNISNSNSYSTNSTSYFENNSPYVRERARLTYEKVAPCLLRAWMYNDTYTNGQKVQLQYPTDAEEHYQVLLEKTKSFRTSSVHQYANYAGPWIENIFIDEFIDRPLSFFNGLIPIFIQWVDNQVLRRWNYDDIHKLLGQLLRPDVIYFTVSQSDLGLGKIGKSHPNLLVLSAGGYGHVVIPLVKGYYDSLPMRKQFKTIIGFYGSVTGRSTRAEMLSVVQKEVPKYGLGYFQAFVSDWERLVDETKFNLAPRGFGRTSFRYAECIQLGRIPVFIYNDHPWIPYTGTDLDIHNYGYVARKSATVDTIPALLQQLAAATDEEIQQKQSALHKVRWYFTYPGIIYEIELFLLDPFGPYGGHLRCATHPVTESCCDS